MRYKEDILGRGLGGKKSGKNSEFFTKSENVHKIMSTNDIRQSEDETCSAKRPTCRQNIRSQSENGFRSSSREKMFDKDVVWKL